MYFDQHCYVACFEMFFSPVISPAGHIPPPLPPFLKPSYDPLSPNIRNSKIREIFACGIRNNAEESGIPPTIEIQTPSSIVKYWNPVPGIRNPQPGIQSPRQSWNPLYGVTLKTLYKPRTFSGSLQYVKSLMTSVDKLVLATVLKRLRWFFFDDLLSAVETDFVMLLSV